MPLTEEELAVQAGVSADEIRKLVDFGIIRGHEVQDGFPSSLIPRVRMAMHLETSGIALEDLAPVIREGSLSLSWADRLISRPDPMLPSTAREVVEELEISPEFSGEVRMALGITDDDALMRGDEARLLDLLSELLAFGVEEELVIRFVHTAVDNIRRVAQAGRELWVKGVEEPLLEAGLTHAELLEEEAEPSDVSQRLAEEMTQILWNRFMEEEIFQAAVQHLEAALEDAGVSRTRERRPDAVAFLDLSGYTNLTERQGDEAAADRARRLVDLIRSHVSRNGGRMVKRLGDGAMLHFQDPVEAVRCTLALVSAISAADLPPARVGINAGPLILRDADFFGRTVNIAARLLDHARPHEVLVTREVADLATDVVFEEVGPVTLKGVTEPMDVFVATGNRQSQTETSDHR